jgi:acyl carrier protein
MNTSEPSTRGRVVAAIAAIVEIEPSRVSGEQRLREDLGMDSLGSLELLSTISEELKIDLEMEDAMGIVTVDDACAFVEGHRAEGERRASGA